MLVQNLPVGCKAGWTGVWIEVALLSIYKKNAEEDERNYRPVSLTLVPYKVIVQIILSEITWHVQDMWGNRRRQHGFMKDRSCLTNPISCDQVACLVDVAKAADIAYLDFSKAIYCLPQHSSGEAGSLRFEQINSSLDKQLAGWPGPESDGEWS